MSRVTHVLTVCLLLVGFAAATGCQSKRPYRAVSDERWIVYDGFDGPGNGKHIVLISGDEEYRSEESIPQLGKILAKHHGFKCTVLFAINEESGDIDPYTLDNIPGLEALESADLMIIFTRFRALPDDQMKLIDDYLKSGRPVIGMRTSTHAFMFDGDEDDEDEAAPTSYGHYSNNYRGPKSEWRGGFGRFILGEKWISHHGHHGEQSTGGLIAPGMQSHPIVRGIKDRDVWGATDVYGVRLPMGGDTEPIILGAVLKGMDAGDDPIEGKKNDPMMPVSWTKTYKLTGGKQGKAFNTTLGASQDMVSEGTRRMLVNAAYWCMGMDGQIPAEGTKVDMVGEYKFRNFGFGREKYTHDLKPSDHGM